MILKPKYLLYFLFSAAAVALLLAYITQYGFGYRPCVLCLYQRIPFYGIVVVTVLGLITPKESIKRYAIYISLMFLLFNSGLAFYHALVEKKVLKFNSACTSSLSGIESVEEMEKQLTEDVVRCDEPAFKIFGLSMAGWNAIYCLALVLFAAINLVKPRKLI